MWRAPAAADELELASMDLDGEQMDEQMEVDLDAEEEAADLDAEEEAADPDEDARPQPSAAVRAFQVEVDAARDEYKRFVQSDDGSGVFDLAFYRQRWEERVRRANAALDAAMAADRPIRTTRRATARIV